MAKIMLNGVDYSAPVASGVAGVKGNAESTYRTGNVNLTPENIGTFPTKSLTQTEYDALSESMKRNGTLYFTSNADHSISKIMLNGINYGISTANLAVTQPFVTDITISGNKIITQYSNGTSVTQFTSSSGEDVIDITGGTYKGFTNAEGVILASIPVAELVYPARYMLFNTVYPGDSHLATTDSDVITFITTNNKQYTMQMAGDTKTCLRNKVICATISDLSSPVKVAVVSIK